MVMPDRQSPRQDRAQKRDAKSGDRRPGYEQNPALVMRWALVTSSCAGGLTLLVEPS